MGSEDFQPPAEGSPGSVGLFIRSPKRHGQKSPAAGVHDNGADISALLSVGRLELLELITVLNGPIGIVICFSDDGVHDTSFPLVDFQVPKFLGTTNSTRQLLRRCLIAAPGDQIILDERRVRQRILFACRTNGANSSRLMAVGKPSVERPQTPLPFDEAYRRRTIKVNNRERPRCAPVRMDVR